MSDPIPTIQRGFTFIRTFEFTDAAGVAINLDSKSIVMNIYGIFPISPFTIGSALPATVNGSDLQITDVMNGKFSFEITDEDTATASDKCGNFTLELIDGGKKNCSGKVKYWLKDNE